jgi:hypothetical protein
LYFVVPSVSGSVSASASVFFSECCEVTALRPMWLCKIGCSDCKLAIDAKAEIQVHYLYLCICWVRI